MTTGATGAMMVFAKVVNTNPAVPLSPAIATTLPALENARLVDPAI